MLVTFLPMNQKIQVNAGSNLFQTAIENGIDLGGICSGNKTCGKCKAMITKGNNKNYSKEERKLLTEEELNSGIRLACCFTITEDTCVIISGKKEKQSQTGYRNDKIENDLRNPLRNPLTEDHYGVAFDIGTTSVAAQLWNISRKEFIDEISSKNPQSLYGADVIARITYANSKEDNVRKLAYLIRECCNTLLLRMSAEHNIDVKQIETAVITANTTMSHLFLGKSVEKLAKVPFQEISYEGVTLKASEVDSEMNLNGEVYVMPGIAGHVGSDTLGCILARDLNHGKGNHLLVDIGTNGEIVLAKNGELSVCSTAAGPAFEGASLHQGMRAIEGAISKVNIRNDLIEIEIIGPGKDATLTYRMNRSGESEGEISDIYPIGICGSGVIEAVSELLSNHIMDQTGRLLGAEGETNYVTLWKHGDKEVILTQKDIRELQLAKGAIYTGIMLLLKEAKLTVPQLDSIILAGAFGSNIDVKKAIHIGLLPPIESNKISYIGNGALEGASKVLLGEISKEEAESISKKIKHLELALCKDFQDEFLKAMNF
jgi:uncharacterized 2Fe-2S/4Fe-4S cluster protein (DUF4445 family)